MQFVGRWCGGVVWVVVVVGVVCGQKVHRISQNGFGDDLKGWVKAVQPSLYLPINVDPESVCGEAMKEMLDALERKEKWPIRMIDSWGKTSDGILFGFREYLGFYDECITTRNTNHTIAGKYCRVGLKAQRENKELQRSLKKIAHHPFFNHDFGLKVSHRLGLGPGQGNGLAFGLGNVQGIFRREEERKEGRTMVGRLEITGSVTYGTCIPSACSAKQLEQSLNQTLSKTIFTPDVSDCQVEDSSPDVEPGDIAFICVVSLLMLVVVVGTTLDMAIDYTKNNSWARGGLRYLLPFSAYTNLGKMFHITTTPSPTNIACLHGMRVLSMAWVIYGHQFGAAALGGGYNWESLLEKTQGILTQIIFNAYLSVDTFFFLSGLLIALGFLRQLKAGKFNIFVFYLHRIVRLVPPIALTAGMMATVTRFFVRGPVSAMYSPDLCAQKWWMDVLFLNNIRSLVLEGDCLGQTWYVAVDSQLYLVAPLLILPLYWTKTLGRLWLYLVTLASAIIPAAITYAHDLPPMSLLSDENGTIYYYYVYVTPWCRAGPWLVGIWLGYILHNLGDRRAKMDPLVVMCGWTIASLMGVLVLLGMWSYNTVPPVAKYDILTSVAYGGLHRIAWGTSLAWVVFACYNGYGGMVNDFLGHPSWQPLSRLTYCIYLVAMSFQFAITTNLRIPYYFTYLNKMTETVGVIGVVFPVALLLSLLVEAPVLGLEKMILTPDRSRTDRQNHNASPSLPKNDEQLNDNPPPQLHHTTTPPQHENHHTTTTA